MPWCPQCKEEYRVGITVCPDCNVELVAALPGNGDFIPVFSFEEEDVAEKFVSYLNYSGIMAKAQSSDEGTISVCVQEKDIKRAKKHFQAFYSVEVSKVFSEEIDEMAQDAAAKKNRDYLKSSAADPSEILTKDSFKTTDEIFEEAIEELEPAAEDVEPYEKRADKAGDMFSTAVIFLVFGAVGLILWTLCIVGVIRLFSGPFFYVFAFIMFAAFLVISFFSFRSYSKYKKEAIEEEAVTKAITEWLEESFTEKEYKAVEAETKQLNPECSEEEVYFHISGKIKSLIVGRFGELDEAYLEYVTEDFYSNNFKEK